MFGSNANGVHVIHKTFDRYLLTQNKPWNYFPLWLHCCKLEPIWKEVSFCLNPASMSGNALIFGVRKFYTSEKKIIAYLHMHKACKVLIEIFLYSFFLLLSSLHWHMKKHDSLEVLFNIFSTLKKGEKN